MNPFEDFAADRGTAPPTAAAGALVKAGGVRSALMGGYIAAVAGQAARLAWLVDHLQLAETYAAMLASIEGLRYRAHDIEALADSLDHDEQTPLLVPGPAGLYLSALINRAPETAVTLRLRSLRCRFHFLGYRLTTGRILRVVGDTGDFTGAGLDGGSLVIEGQTGSWCGAGMLSGRIHVQGDAGRHTGQWMHGGDLRVDGEIAGLGDNRHGGRVRRSPATEGA